MPLVDMADYVDGFTELKALSGYGFHQTHPEQVSGMFGLAEYPRPYFANTGFSGLGCGGDCACAKCRGVSGLGDIDFSGLGAEAYGEAYENTLKAIQGATTEEELKRLDAAAASADNQYISTAGYTNLTNMVRLKIAQIRKAGGAVNPIDPSSWQAKADVVVNSFQKLASGFAPFLQRGPKQKVIVEKQPDYTTYAVIGGAVIVASVLAIAVGKSGRK